MRAKGRMAVPPADIFYALQWAERCPQIAPVLGGSGPPIICGSECRRESTPPNGISIGLAVLAQVMVVTIRNTQTTLGLAIRMGHI